MTTPIQITVTAQAQAAQANLSQFFTDLQGNINLARNGLGQLSSELTATGAGIGSNRMALMELGHSARSIAGGLAAGMSPWRLAMMEAPRLTQAFGEANSDLRAKIVRLLPILGGVAAAIGVGVVAWKAFHAEQERIIEQTNQLADAFKELPKVLDQVNAASRAGVLTPADRDRLLGMMGLNVNAGKPITALGPMINPGAATPQYNAQPPARFDMTQLGLPDKFDLQSTQEEMYKLGILVKEIGKDNKPSYFLNPEIAQLEELAKMREQDSVAMASGADKQIAIAKRVHDEQLKTFEEDLAAAENFRQQLLNKLSAAEGNAPLQAAIKTEMAQYDPAKFADMRKQFDQEYANKIADIQQKAQDEKVRQQIESANKAQTQAKADAANDLRSIEDQITAMENKAGELRGQQYQAEYKLRIDAAQQAYFSGEIGEDDYTHHVAEAAAKRAEAEKEYHQALQRTIDLQNQLARGKAENALVAIDQNPNLTEDQKREQSIPVYQEQLGQVNTEIGQQAAVAWNASNINDRLQAQMKLLQLQREQLQLENELRRAQTDGSWQTLYTQNLIKIQNTWGQLKDNLVNGSFREVQDGIRSFASALTSVVLGTKDAGAAFAQMGIQMLASFIEMITEQILWAEVAIPILTALGVLSGGTTAAAGAGVTTAAVVGTITTVTGMMGFAAGGRPPIGVPSIVGENGPEVFVPDVAGTIIPNHQLQSMSIQPGGAAAAPGVSGSDPNIHLVVVNSQEEYRKFMESNAGKKITIHHVGSSKNELGIPQ